jgi:hypothetical protein
LISFLTSFTLFHLLLKRDVIGCRFTRWSFFWITETSELLLSSTQML